jgi:tetratricopeptide (TPR) repeat protein
MAVIVFLSSVSDEFHRDDPSQLRRFASYRDVLANALRAASDEYVVRTEEVLAPGLGDLLHSLDQEIQRCDVVVHLVGNLSGSCPQTAELRRLRERHPKFLDHQPELRDALAGVADVSYTQWEIYLAFEHDRNRFVFVADPSAPRSPRCPVEPMQPSQTAHLARLELTGVYRESFTDQNHLGLRLFILFQRWGLVPGAEPAAEPPPRATTREEAAALTHEIAAAIRKPAEAVSAALDPVGVETYLRAIDTAALQRELSRRQALEIVEGYHDDLREAVARDPNEADLRELALAALATGRYPDAIDAALCCAALAEQNITSDPGQAGRHRETALNAYLLVREAAVAAHRRDEALSALERGCSLIDPARDPILWAEYHQELAQILLDQAQLDRAEDVINDLVDVREEHEPESVGLASTLLLWCRLLNARARHQDTIGVARRAERIFAGQTPPNPSGLASAISEQATALYHLRRLSEAEPLMRRALAIAERTYGPDHSDIATDLDNLAALLQDTGRLSEAEPLTRRALAIGERTYGPDHPGVATDLDNLAALLQDTGHLSEAEPLMARAVRIFSRFQRSTGHEHPYLRGMLVNYYQLLIVLKLAGPEIAARIKAALGEMDDLSPIVPEVERLLGPARPTDDVFEALDRQYREQGKPPVWFLPLEEPMVPHLDQLLGPARTVEEVLAALNEQYRAQGKPALWFLPLTEPIAPHLDELLGETSNE